MIYRSGHLAKLTNDEFEELKSLGLKTVVDLRTKGEVQEKVDNIPANQGILWQHIPITGITDEELELAKKEIRKQSPEEFDGAGKMQLMMERFTEQGTEDFRKIFDLLLDDARTPLSYHCTAGKDRTGLMTALILSALGVDESVIMNEYLLSNYYRYDHIEQRVKLGAMIGIDTRSSKAMMDVRKEYLEASYRFIAEEYGTMEDYLFNEIGLTREEVHNLKRKFLY